MKKILSLLVIMAMLLCFAACGKTDADTTTDTTAGKTDKPVTEEQTPPADEEQTPPVDEDQTNEEENTDDTGDNTENTDEEEVDDRNNPYNDYDDYDDSDDMYNDFYEDEEYFDNDFIVEENDISLIETAIDTFCSQHSCEYQCTLTAIVTDSTNVKIVHTITSDVAENDAPHIDTVNKHLAEALENELNNNPVFPETIAVIF